MSTKTPAELTQELTSTGTLIKLLTTQLEDAYKSRLQEFNEKERKWAELEKKIDQVASTAPSMVVLNVGGKTFATSKSTLLSQPDSFFTAMLCSERWKPNQDGSYFIDRNPKHFGRILDYLRMGKLRVADLHAEQLESLKEEFGFYQIVFPVPPPVPRSFVIKDGFTFANDNKTITKQRADNCVVRYDKALQPGLGYEWTIRLDNIVDSYWIVVGVGPENAANGTQLYGISSKNQVFPANGSTTASGDWATGDHIHVSFKDSNVTVTNKRTGRSHSVTTAGSATLYPSFDVYTQGLSISIVDFKQL